jgi:hypothetical protein
MKSTCNRMNWVMATHPNSAFPFAFFGAGRRLRSPTPCVSVGIPNDPIDPHRPTPATPITFYATDHRPPHLPITLIYPPRRHDRHSLSPSSLDCFVSYVAGLYPRRAPCVSVGIPKPPTDPKPPSPMAAPRNPTPPTSSQRPTQQNSASTYPNILSSNATPSQHELPCNQCPAPPPCASSSPTVAPKASVSSRNPTGPATPSSAPALASPPRETARNSTVPAFTSSPASPQTQACPVSTSARVTPSVPASTPTSATKTSGPPSPSSPVAPKTSTKPTSNSSSPAS